MKGSPLTFTIAPSRRLRLAVVAVHALAGLAVARADLAGWLAALLTMAIVASLAWSLRPAVPVILQCRPDGALSLLAGEDWQAVELLPDSVVLAWLVLLRYRKAAGARPTTVVVMPDCLDADAFRRLRVWLRWRAMVSGREEKAQA